MYYSYFESNKLYFMNVGKYTIYIVYKLIKTVYSMYYIYTNTILYGYIRYKARTKVEQKGLHLKGLRIPILVYNLGVMAREDGNRKSAYSNFC